VGYWPGGGFLIEDLFAATNGDGPVYADKHLVVTRTENPDGFRFAGEIDITNSDAVMQSLRMAMADAGDPHLDLSRLSFCDISGIRALVDTSTSLGVGRRILLHGLPEQLETVMRVTGWSGLPSLTLCTCGGEAD
jgi:anti-anti-sigma factor